MLDPRLRTLNTLTEHNNPNSSKDWDDSELSWPGQGKHNKALKKILDSQKKNKKLNPKNYSKEPREKRGLEQHQHQKFPAELQLRVGNLERKKHLEIQKNSSYNSHYNKVGSSFDEPVLRFHELHADYRGRDEETKKYKEQLQAMH